MRRHITGNEAAHAVGMLQAGQVQRAIAGHFNVSQSVISRLWNRFQHTGNVAERSRSDRPRKTTVCAKIVISPIWQSGRGSRVLLGSIQTFVQLQEYMCHHKQSETDCIQLICMPTDQQFVPYWPWDTEQRALAVGKGPCELATASLDSCSFNRRVTFLCRRSWRTHACMVHARWTLCRLLCNWTRSFRRWFCDGLGWYQYRR